jgi:DNA-binding FadR family transcriptional regulator
MSVDASFQGRPAQRPRVTDHVFEELLGAILLGDFKPGAVVPTQRQLSKQFGVSPLVVRQAIHRLEELSLVRVRQGSPTIVLDPQDVSDVRLIQLQLQAATPGDALMLAGLEIRVLSTLPLLMLAERRITDQELAELDALVDSLTDQPSPEELSEFQAEYWERMARATRNPLLRHQVRWWFRILGQVRGGAMLRTVHAQPQHYRDINRALRKRHGAMELMLGPAARLFDWAEAQPGHTRNVEREAKRARRTAAARPSGNARR